MLVGIPIRQASLELSATSAAAQPPEDRQPAGPMPEPFHLELSAGERHGADSNDVGFDMAKRCSAGGSRLQRVDLSDAV
jgi:hypothetical protein